MSTLSPYPTYDCTHGRVNGRILQDKFGQFDGYVTRLWCQILAVYPTEHYLEVKSSDEVQIKVVLVNLDTAKLDKINEFKVNTFVEVIGKVRTPTELHADCAQIIQFGDDFDMKLANDVIELWHDPRFAKMVQQ